MPLIGWVVLGLAAGAALAVILLFPSDNAPTLNLFAFFVVTLVVALPALAVARIMSVGHRTVDDWLVLPEGRALGLALLAVAVAAALPWIVAVMEELEWLPGSVGTIGLAIAIWFAARQVTPGWAVLASIALVWYCSVAALLSHGLAEWAEWQDLHWRETTDDPLAGSSVDIGWGILGAIVFAPVAGAAIGLLSPVNKPPTDAAASVLPVSARR
jgi:hypothetical protein